MNADLFYFMQVGDRVDAYLDPDTASPLESAFYHEFLGFLNQGRFKASIPTNRNAHFFASQRNVLFKTVRSMVWTPQYM